MDSAHRPASPVGAILGDYELSAALGGGPFGQVYLARHRDRDFACVVKVFNPGRCNAAALHRSVAVSRAAFAIAEARACHIYEAHPDGPQPFFALELVSGESLENLRRRSTRLAWDQVREIAGPVAASLAAAHRAGVLHGNLKPTNIRVLRDLAGHTSVRLLDWGLGSTRESEHDQGATRADLSVAVDYQAPEQLQGAPPTPATDLYALGVILYEAVTGQRPFHGTPSMVAMHHLRTPPPAPRTLVPDLPAEVEALLLRLLDKDPRRRPRTDELQAQLRAPDPAPLHPSDAEPATELFVRTPARPLRPTSATPPGGETTVVTTQPLARPGPRQAETVILAAPPVPQPQDQGAVTLVLEPNQGQFLLETDPGVRVQHHPSEQTTVSTNSSATVFVRQMSPAFFQPAPATTAPPARSWRRWLQGPWSLEKKLIVVNVMFGLVILVGLGLFAASRS